MKTLLKTIEITAAIGFIYMAIVFGNEVVITNLYAALALMAISMMAGAKLRSDKMWEITHPKKDEE